MAKRQLPTYFIESNESETALIPAKDIPIPTRIANDPVKSQLWTILVCDLEKRKVLSPAYVLLLSELVEVTCTILRCREELDENGYVNDIFNDEGQWIGQKASPWENILSRQQALQLRILEKLGLTVREIQFLSETEPAEQIRQINAEFQNITYFRT